MVFSDKQLSFIYLNLCERMTGKSRGAIMKEYQRNRLSTWCEEDLEIYLRNRIAELPQKIVEKEEPKIIEKPKVTNGQALMAEIMKKVADKPAPITQPTSTTVKGVYVPPTDKYGFYEE